MGLFARARLPGGAVMSRLGGVLVTSGQLRALLAQAARDERGYVDTNVVGEDRHLVLPAGVPNGRGNHSCDPNTWWVDAYTLAARREVPAGAEVTNDYATSTADESFVMACSCSSPLCRRVVSGGDWRRVDLRERYGEHWVPAVLTLIHSEGPRRQAPRKRTSAGNQPPSQSRSWILDWHRQPRTVLTG